MKTDNAEAHFFLCNSNGPESAETQSGLEFSPVQPETAPSSLILLPVSARENSGIRAGKKRGSVLHRGRYLEMIEAAQRRAQKRAQMARTPCYSSIITSARLFCRRAA